MDMSNAYINQPIRSLQTMLRMLSNVYPKIPPLIPDGIYGEKTVQAVSAFQREQGLPMTGVVNDTTWQAVVAAYRSAVIYIGPAAPLLVPLIPNQVISNASPCIHLWLIQAMLHVIGQCVGNFPAVEINGEYDAQTEQAIAFFQQLSGLTHCDHGCVDRLTWKYLSQVYTAVTNATPLPDSEDGGTKPETECETQ